MAEATTIDKEIISIGLDLQRRKKVVMVGARWAGLGIAHHLSKPSIVGSSAVGGFF